MIKFGTGGFRAIIGEDFTKENIQILSKALCDKMKKESVENTGMVIGNPYKPGHRLLPNQSLACLFETSHQ